MLWPSCTAFPPFQRHCHSFRSAHGSPGYSDPERAVYPDSSPALKKRESVILGDRPTDQPTDRQCEGCPGVRRGTPIPETRPAARLGRVPNPAPNPPLKKAVGLGVREYRLKLAFLMIPPARRNSETVSNTPGQGSLHWKFRWSTRERGDGSHMFWVVYRVTCCLVISMLLQLV